MFERNINKNTAIDYINTISRTIMKCDTTFDLASVDEEDLEFMINTHVEKHTLSGNTKQKYGTIISSLLGYAKKHGALFCSIPTIGKYGYITQKYRKILITPINFNLLLHELAKDPSHEIQTAICFLILGYCCGLRASEVENLTYQDIFNKKGELYVYIQETKTPAGRRKIPAHLLIPEHWLEYLSSYI